MEEEKLFIIGKRFGIVLLYFCCLAIVLGGCSFLQRPVKIDEPAVPQPMLRVGAIPAESVEKTRDDLQSLMEHLEKETGFKVELLVTTDYRSVIDKMVQNEVDIAMLGPFSYVLANEKANAQAFASTEKSGIGKKYYSVVIVHPESGIENISQLQGRRLAFTDRNSTSGYLIPKTILLKNGIDPDVDLESVEFLDHHDAAILAVKKQMVDAAAVSSTILQNMREKGIVGDKDYRIIYTSGAIPGSGIVWAYRKGLSQETVAKIKNAVFEANRTEGALGIFGTEIGEFFPVDDQEFDAIRDAYHMLEMGK